MVVLKVGLYAAPPGGRPEGYRAGGGRCPARGLPPCLILFFRLSDLLGVEPLDDLSGDLPHTFILPLRKWRALNPSSRAGMDEAPPGIGPDKFPSSGDER